MPYYFALGLFFIFTQGVSAATLYLDPPSTTLGRGDAVTVSIRLDTDESVNECINALDVTIMYPESIVPVDISLGSSIVPIWVEPPTINKDSRTITMAGGIPNGYCGRVEGDPRLTNVIAEMIFRAPGLQVGGGADSGVASLSFGQETSLYLNDGFGTKALTSVLGAVFTISSSPSSRIVDDWRTDVNADDVPPEEFSITLERDAAGITANGKYYIVFNTTDKQTGLSHYEVIEEPIDQMSLFGFGAATAPWQEVRSPYVLRDQTLNSAIRVRAIDKAGNEYVASLLPSEDIRVAQSPARWLVIGVVTLLLLSITSVCAIWWLRKRRSRSDASLLVE